MKKIKPFLASATILTVSAGLFSFASANDLNKQTVNAVVTANQSVTSKEAASGWALAWSGNYSGLLAWETSAN